MATRQTLVLVIDQLVYEYQAGAWKGVCDQCIEDGINLVSLSGLSINPSDAVTDTANRIYRHIPYQSVDGVIVLSGSVLSIIQGSEKLEHFNRLASNTPAISIGIDIPGHRSITVDNYSGMFDAVCHLVELHKLSKIAFIGGPQGNAEADERYRAYRQALTKNNIEVDPKYYYEGDFSPPAGTRGVKTFLDERKLEVEAIVCASDYMAFEVLIELENRGIAVPQQIAVVGFDNVEKTNVTNPPLSSVKQSIYTLGRQAVIEMQNIFKKKSLSKNWFSLQNL